MELIVLHGPPAVGKLTVGLHLARLTGYRLFHNHLTFDVAASLFELWTPEFFGLCDTLRVATIEAAAKSNLPGMIFTFCMASSGDRAFAEGCARIVESHGGRARFVQLRAPRATLEQRVVDPSRTKHGKIQSSELLRSVLDEHDFAVVVPGYTAFELDTSRHEPEASAELIAAAFGLGDSPLAEPKS